MYNIGMEGVSDYEDLRKKGEANLWRCPYLK